MGKLDAVENIVRVADMSGNCFSSEQLSDTICSVLNNMYDWLPKSLPSAISGIKMEKEADELLRKLLEENKLEHEMNKAHIMPFLALVYSLPNATDECIVPDFSDAISAYGKILCTCDGGCIAYDSDTLIVEKVVNIDIKSLAYVLMDNIVDLNEVANAEELERYNNGEAVCVDVDYDVPDGIKISVAGERRKGWVFGSSDCATLAVVGALRIGEQDVYGMCADGEHIMHIHHAHKYKGYVERLDVDTSFYQCKKKDTVWESPRGYEEIINGCVPVRGCAYDSESHTGVIDLEGIEKSILSSDRVCAFGRVFGSKFNGDYIVAYMDGEYEGCSKYFIGDLYIHGDVLEIYKKVRDILIDKISSVVSLALLLPISDGKAVAHVLDEIYYLNASDELKHGSWNGLLDYGQLRRSVEEDIEAYASGKYIVDNECKLDFYPEINRVWLGYKYHILSKSKMSVSEFTYNGHFVVKSHIYRRSQGFRKDVLWMDSDKLGHKVVYTISQLPNGVDLMGSLIDTYRQMICYMNGEGAGYRMEGKGYIQRSFIRRFKF